MKVVEKDRIEQLLGFFMQPWFIWVYLEEQRFMHLFY